MLNEIHDQLMLAKQRLRTKQKLNAMLREAQTILDDEQRKCRRCQDVLAEERADVENLEGFSLTGLFYSILGTKDDRLATERQEFLAAKLKHEESIQAVDDARQDLAKLQSELDAYRNAEDEYGRLLEEKEQRIAETGNEDASALIALSEQLADLASDRKELQEAVKVGGMAQRSLDRVRSELQAAENWGTWDMLGGGTMSTWAKHSRIDSAKQQARVAQRRLRRFREELADADQRLRVSLGDIGGFSTFADYFFDGLIADWMMQSKIQNSLGACSSAIRRVSATLDQCRRRLDETEREIEAVEEKRRRFIEDA